jgi:hypothetical protein
MLLKGVIMPVSIPESVFQKYYDVVDSTFQIFGVTCTLVYPQTVEEISNTYDNIPENRSINAHRRHGNQLYKQQNHTYREVETYEDIKLKVYWDAKSFIKVSASMIVPDNSIQTIFFATDLGKINRAKEMIVHKGIQDKVEMRFKKWGESVPMGLRQDRYFACFWVRA